MLDAVGIGIGLPIASTIVEDQFFAGMYWSRSTEPEITPVLVSLHIDTLLYGSILGTIHETQVGRAHVSLDPKRVAVGRTGGKHVLVVS